MYCSPLSPEFFKLSSMDQYLIKTHLTRKVQRHWEIGKVAQQLIIPIIFDWKYKTGREARNFIRGKRGGSYKPLHVKEDDWNAIVAEEKAKLSGEKPLSPQQKVANQRWRGSKKPRPPNCHGAEGRKGFKRFFQRRFGRPPT